MIRLGVNIDHVATIRQARLTFEPDPVAAALAAQLGGADGITLHVREDRRHVQDDDLHRLREIVGVPLNLEMAATDEMVALAGAAGPDMAMLVPEGRDEVTTEGGLDVAADRERLSGIVAALKDAGMRVSAFIDPCIEQVDAAGACGFEVCEVHTGAFAAAVEAGGFDLETHAVAAEVSRVAEAGAEILGRDMQFNAGHGLTHQNVQPIASLPGLEELHIGHSIVSRSILVGMRESVASMKRLMVEAAG